MPTQKRESSCSELPEPGAARCTASKLGTNKYRPLTQVVGGGVGRAQGTPEAGPGQGPTQPQASAALTRWRDQAWDLRCASGVRACAARYPLCFSRPLHLPHPFLRKSSFCSRASPGAVRKVEGGTGTAWAEVRCPGLSLALASPGAPGRAAPVLCAPHSLHKPTTSTQDTPTAPPPTSGIPGTLGKPRWV